MKATSPVQLEYLTLLHDTRQRLLKIGLELEGPQRVNAMRLAALMQQMSKVRPPAKSRAMADVPCWSRS